MSSIQDFYRGKKLLITGVTGFVGKVLLEKFLWSLPEIDKIFILIRNKVLYHFFHFSNNFFLERVKFSRKVQKGDF